MTKTYNKQRSRNRGMTSLNLTNYLHCHFEGRPVAKVPSYRLARWPERGSLLPLHRGSLPGLARWHGCLLSPDRGSLPSLPSLPSLHRGSHDWGSPGHHGHDHLVVIRGPLPDVCLHLLFLRFGVATATLELLHQWYIRIILTHFDGLIWVTHLKQLRV